MFGSTVVPESKFVPVRVTATAVPGLPDDGAMAVKVGADWALTYDSPLDRIAMDTSSKALRMPVGPP